MACLAWRACRPPALALPQLRRTLPGPCSGPTRGTMTLSRRYRGSPLTLSPSTTTATAKSGCARAEGEAHVAVGRAACLPRRRPRRLSTPPLCTFADTKSSTAQAPRCVRPPCLCCAPVPLLQTPRFRAASCALIASSPTLAHSILGRAAQNRRRRRGAVLPRQNHLDDRVQRWPGRQPHQRQRARPLSGHAGLVVDAAASPGAAG